MSPIPVHPGLAPLLDGHDGLILDLWGVIHDGRKPYPHVSETLAQLRDAGKEVVMLSNAPRRGQAVADAMTDMGIDPALYNGVMTSGEMAWRALHARTEDWTKDLGYRCLHVGPDRDIGLFEGLGLTMLDAPEEGGFIVNTGPWRDEETVADYEDVLAASAGVGMPMICANPDLEVIRGGMRIVCAGALAVRYRDLGGVVHEFGKPHAHAYIACLEMMSVTEKARLMAVGDSLSTDIKGAASAGVDAVLVTSGIHADELGLAWGEVPDSDRVTAACAQRGLAPLAAIPAFIW